MTSTDKCTIDPKAILSLDDPRTGDDLKGCTFTDATADRVAQQIDFEGRFSQNDAATLVNAYYDMWSSDWFPPATEGDKRVVRLGQRLAAIAGIPSAHANGLKPPEHAGFNTRIDRYFGTVRASFTANPEGHRLLTTAALSADSIKTPGSRGTTQSLEAALTQAMNGLNLLKAPDYGGASFAVSERTIEEIVDLVERLGQTGTSEERRQLAMELAYANENGGNATSASAYTRFSELINSLRHSEGIGRTTPAAIGFQEYSGGDLADDTKLPVGKKLDEAINAFIANN